MWWWEIQPLPKAQAKQSVLVDEVWVATQHIKEIVSAAIDKPVYKIPLPLPFRTETVTPRRAHFGLPDDRFVFLFSFDAFSSIERKNPAGLIEAYTQAFGPNDDALLYIKSINASHNPWPTEALWYSVRNRPDIRLVDQYLPASEVAELTASCDCYISLHRAEGLGLTMAQAMGMGKPVIATGYSGNLEFMTPENSYLVDYTLTEIGPGCDPYPAGGVWADPSTASAAQAMRTVFENHAESVAKGARARADIGLHTVDRTARFIQSRFESIHKSSMWKKSRAYARSTR